MTGLFSKPPDPKDPAPMPDPYDTSGRRDDVRKLRESSSTTQNRIAQVPGTIGREYSKALRRAKNVDARNENNKIIVHGSWLRARQGGAGVGRNGGGTIVGGEITLGEGDV